MAIYIITGMLINKSLYRNASSLEAKIPESDNDYDGGSATKLQEFLLTSPIPFSFFF